MSRLLEAVCALTVGVLVALLCGVLTLEPCGRRGGRAS
jgi:hypothetical protein